MIAPSDEVLSWAQLVVLCLAAGLLIAGDLAFLLLVGRLVRSLERWETMTAAVHRSLVAARFLPAERAGEAAPSTFPPRRSHPEAVALDRRRTERRDGTGGAW